jgi:protein-disulfide isomerase
MMMKRLTGWIALAVIVCAGLGIAPGAVRAQAPPALPETYTWEPYGLAVSYPADWTVMESGSMISLHPAGRDVSDGQGPELILFTVPGTDPLQLDAAILNYTTAINGPITPVIAGRLEGRATRTFSFDQSQPDTVGAVLLIAGEDQTALGMAYTVRDLEADQFRPTLDAMVASLTFGDERPGDQPPTDQPTTDQPANGAQVYQDATYGYSLDYPAEWTLAPDTTPGAIRLAPTGITVSPESGPEYVVLVLDGLDTSDLDLVLAELLAGRPGTFSVPSANQLDGHATRFVAYVNTEASPVVSGAIYLVQISDNVVLAMGYRAVTTELPVYEPVFESIRESVRFPADTAPDPASGTTQVVSQSVASVQLPQRYDWAGGGLVFYLPADWTFEAGSDEGYAVMTAEPAPSSDSPVWLVQGSTVSWSVALDLHDLPEATVGDGEIVGEVVDIAAAGYEGVMYDMLDASISPALHLRALLVAIPEQKIATMVLFAAEEDDWETFRPTVDAIVASLEPSSGSQSSYPDTLVHARLSLVQDATPIPVRQDTAMIEFMWDNYGVSLMIPENWQALSGGQDYDLALASPDAFDSDQGAYITWQHIPSLGSMSFIEAFEPLAEDVGSPVEPYTVGDLEGVGITVENEDDGSIQRLILLPYGDRGEAFYLQALSLNGQDPLIQSIIQSYTANPPKPDEDAINAAWQASLESEGRLLYGDPDAPVQMLEVFDFSCGHCAHYHLDVGRFQALEVEQGRARFEWALLGVSELSLNADYATMCATEQGVGYSVYSALFVNYMAQGREVAYSREGINDLLADEFDLDMDALNACIDAQTYQGALDRMRAVANQYEVTGTPSVLFGTSEDDLGFLIFPGGTEIDRWSGTIPLDVLRLTVSRLADDGVSLSEVFDTE